MTRIPRVFCIVDATDPLSLLPALAEAGVEGFQVRAKSLTAAELLAFTRRVIAAVPDLPVVVNDRLDVAMAAGAAGVHVGADDLPVAEARQLAPHLLIGGTCRTRQSAIAMHQAGADYVGFGPIFATSSKDGLPGPLGVDAIRTVADVLPVIAIGGMDAHRAAAARTAGAHGIAVIGAIWNSLDPVAAAKELSGELAS